MRKSTAMLLAALFSSLAAGCHTAPDRKSLAARKPAEEYVWYTPTGSHIPLYIRKSELVDRENTKSDQEAMRDATRRGLHMDRSGD
jgi:hypothetical protein